MTWHPLSSHLVSFCVGAPQVGDVTLYIVPVSVDSTSYFSLSEGFPVGRPIYGTYFTVHPRLSFCDEGEPPTPFSPFREWTSNTG